MSNIENNEMPEGFADPNYGGARFQNWSLEKDSTAVFRILPAMKSLVKGRDYTTFWHTYFWQGRDAKGKVRGIPILCTREREFQFGKSTVTKECPLFVKRQKHLDRIEEIKAIGRQKNASEAQIKKAQAPHTQWLKDHGYDGKYRVYAVNQRGELGVLRLNTQAMKALRTKVKALIQDGYTPMGVKGVWFEFTRTGNGFGTPDTVDVHRTKRPDGSEVIATHILDKRLAQEALAVLPDFEAEKAKIRYSDEQLQQIADLEDDNPDEVSRILGIKAEPVDEEATFLEEGATPAEEDLFSMASDEIKTPAKAAAKPAAAKAVKPAAAAEEVSNDEFEAEFNAI